MLTAGYGTRATAESGATRYERSAVRLGPSRSSCSVDGQLFPEVDSALRESNGARYLISVGANGRFSVPVPVGTYTVSGQNSKYEGGSAKCQASGPVKVTKGVTSSVEVDCQEM